MKRHSRLEYYKFLFSFLCYLCKTSSNSFSYQTSVNMWVSVTHPFWLLLAFFAFFPFLAFFFLCFRPFLPCLLPCLINIFFLIISFRLFSNFLSFLNFRLPFLASLQTPKYIDNDNNYVFAQNIVFSI